MKPVPKKKHKKQRAAKQRRKHRETAARATPATPPPVSSSPTQPAALAPGVQAPLFAELEDQQTPELTASIPQLAVCFGHSRATVSEQIQRAGLQPVVMVRGYPRYSVREYVEIERRSDHADPDSMNPFERHAHFKAETEKLRVMQQRRELIARWDVEREMARIAKIFAEALETLPDVLERDVGISPALAIRIEAICDKTREEVAQCLASEDADQQTVPEASCTTADAA